jgi:hypothetical protein
MHETLQHESGSRIRPVRIGQEIDQGESGHEDEADAEIPELGSETGMEIDQRENQTDSQEEGAEQLERKRHGRVRRAS